MPNESRDHVEPWLPAVFCAVLGAIYTTIGGWAVLKGGAMGDLCFLYMMFMPMCYFVGAYLAKLCADNAELRARLDAIDARIS